MDDGRSFGPISKAVRMETFKTGFDLLKGPNEPI